MGEKQEFSFGQFMFENASETSRWRRQYKSGIQRRDVKWKYKYRSHQHIGETESLQNRWNHTREVSVEKTEGQRPEPQSAGKGRRICKRSTGVKMATEVIAWPREDKPKDTNLIHNRFPD